MDNHIPIDNCSEVFRLVCPLTWDKLKLTAEDGVRHCEVCNRDVYLCSSPEMVALRSAANDCIAVRIIKAEKIHDLGLMIGQPHKDEDTVEHGRQRS